MENEEKSIEVHVVSDATGATAERVLDAALTQFDTSFVSVKKFTDVRDISQIHTIVDNASTAHAFIIHTLVSQKLRQAVYELGKIRNVATIDLMGPLLTRLSDLLTMTPRAEPGLFQPFNNDYQRRIDAIEFTVEHDDGQAMDDLDNAEIVLLGVSRTSKTPLSMYLANLGWRVANIPIVLDVEPPEIIYSLPRRKIIGLVIQPERLASLRKARSSYLAVPFSDYADIDQIKKEIVHAYHVFDKRKDLYLIDVTAKPIEETAAEVISYVSSLK